MLETMPNTFALPGRVLQQNAELAEIQTSTSDLDARRASANAVGFTRAARATRMNDEIIDTQENRPHNFLPKRHARFLQHQLISRREIYQVVAMDNDWTELCYSPDSLEKSDVRGRERLRCPSPRVARKDLHRIAASVTRDDKRLVQPAFDWSVKADARSSRIVRLFHCVIDSLGLPVQSSRTLGKPQK